MSIYKPLRSAVKNPWTLEERKFLLAQHEKMYIEDIASHLGRTITATKSKAQAMGCSIKLTPKGKL